MSSKIYIAFLDSLDSAWRKSVMCKVHKLGATGKIWSIINDMHVNTMSSVILNQCQSKFFPVLQGVRQGGVLSGLLYYFYR